MSCPIVLHLPAVTCQHKKSKDKQLETKQVTVLPIVVDFERLLKETTKNHEEIIAGIPNTDLLHAVATLYGNSLPEVTDDIIYPTLCEKWSRTILMIRDEKEVKEHFKKSVHAKKDSKKKPALKSEDANDDGEDKDIFSDEEEVEEEDQDEEVDDNFFSTLPAFLQTVQGRRDQKEKWVKDTSSEDREIPNNLIGIEHRLIGCSTFERSYEKPGHRVLQLTLMAVRRKYQGYGMGHFMMNQIQDATITGGMDVIVVNADQNAVEFFEKEGFTDDVILNSQFAHIGDIWFNSKRMCYLPAYARATQHSGQGDVCNNTDLREMEIEIALWREKSLQAYQSQALIVHRMRREVLTLRAQLGLKDDKIMSLRTELDAQRDLRVDSQETGLRLRLDNLKSAMNSLEITEKQVESIASGMSSSAQDVSSYDEEKQDNKDENFGTPSPEIEDDISEDLEGKNDTDSSRNESLYANASSTLSVNTGGLSEIALHEIKHCFVMSMDISPSNFTGLEYQVTNVSNVTPSLLPSGIKLRFAKAIKASKDQDIVTNLYYCGTQNQTSKEQFKHINKYGFSLGDFAVSDFGRGLHFSRYARAAARFSPRGSILVAKVCLGHTQTVTVKDPTRKQAPDGFDSILTQGRLSNIETGIVSSRAWQMGHSEYIVFRHDCAIPVALIEYNLIC